MIVPTVVVGLVIESGVLCVNALCCGVYNYKCSVHALTLVPLDALATVVNRSYRIMFVD